MPEPLRPGHLPLIQERETRFDDPSAIGSLRGARRLWEDAALAEGRSEIYSLHFTYTCRSEARALRVATALRRRSVCASAQLAPSSRPGSELWHVQGRTHPAPQSLANLEQLSNWLRDLSDSHQVSLVRLTLA